LTSIHLPILAERRSMVKVLTLKERFLVVFHSKEKKRGKKKGTQEKRRKKKKEKKSCKKILGTTDRSTPIRLWGAQSVKQKICVQLTPRSDRGDPHSP